MLHESLFFLKIYDMLGAHDIVWSTGGLIVGRESREDEWVCGGGGTCRTGVQSQARF